MGLDDAGPGEMAEVRGLNTPHRSGIGILGESGSKLRRGTERPWTFRDPQRCKPALTGRGLAFSGAPSSGEKFNSKKFRGKRRILLTRIPEKS